MNSQFLIDTFLRYDNNFRLATLKFSEPSSYPSGDPFLVRFITKLLDVLFCVLYQLSGHDMIALKY